MTIKTKQLTVSNAAGSFQAYFAAPDTPAATTTPGVLVIQEIFGVNSHIRSVTERFAAAGYAALAPDIFWRIQPGIELGYSADDVTKGRELKSQMNTDEVLDDLAASLQTLAAQPECQGQKLGITGYCYGGLLTYVAAARLQPACASAYYGGGIVDYLNEADNIRCPIQFHFGEHDASIPLDHVEQVRQTMNKHETAEVFVYPGAQHGFHCDQRGSYDAASADLAWQRTMHLFSSQLS